ncbi:MAG: VOC family protein [Hyphomicrobiaceae bacterium]|nr:VOC family protein [Hyphomicrobiaceae bacterium]
MPAIPEGFHTITPYIVVRDGNTALALYEKAFGAEVLGRLSMPGSDKVLHASLQIGSSKLFLSDENPDMGMMAPGSEVGTRFYLYVDDVDAAHKRAVDADLKEMSPPEDAFWGDRTAVLEDPWGHRWTLATHVKDVSMDDMMDAMKAMAE